MGISVQPCCCDMTPTERWIIGTTQQASPFEDYLYDIDLSTAAISNPILADDGAFAMRQDPSTNIVYATGEDTLHTIDPDTGAIALVGSLGGAFTRFNTGGMAFSTIDGTLFACWEGSELFTTPSYLWTIDPGTGAGTLVGEMAPVTTPDFDGMDFDPTTNILWGIGAALILGIRYYFTYTIDTATGAATPVAQLTPDLIGNVSAGFAITSDGRFYMARGLPALGYDHQLIEITDPTTGAWSVVGNISGLDANTYIGHLLHIAS